jgi:nitroreductase
MQPGIMPLNDLSTVLEFLKTRKSGSAKTMSGPGPSQAQIDQVLEIAVRVPDHGKLTPWRFVLFEGEARRAAGEKFATRWHELHPDHGEESLAFQRGLLARAPLVIAVISKTAPHAKIPAWEQTLSSAAVCYNIVLAATAMGFAAQWQTDWIAYDDAARAIIGCEAGEVVAGLIYLGTATAPLEDRPRPDTKALVTRWTT